ncbi:hypothetical protein SAMN02745157_4858 [Kaistia soli DSM 19436]|uniref:Uncharacterized protein n=1 Tax=Kaistia soli DSM 19436 TaxID=1122133 RepID=A0A1M5MR84_9HYPH|nr:hypothetical protein [Kaistia soli]SHG79735.1 hypothetical protein SAMN02745157_4858 [Kaistia soli DSM 19436]
MTIHGFIDPPSPFASVEEWEAFVRDVEDLEDQSPEVARELREARRIIAEKKAANA